MSQCLLSFAIVTRQVVDEAMGPVRIVGILVVGLVYSDLKPENVVARG